MSILHHKDMNISEWQEYYHTSNAFKNKHNRIMAKSPLEERWQWIEKTNSREYQCPTKTRHPLLGYQKSCCHWAIIANDTIKALLILQISCQKFKIYENFTKQRDETETKERWYLDGFSGFCTYASEDKICLLQVWNPKCRKLFSSSSPLEARGCHQLPCLFHNDNRATSSIKRELQEVTPKAGGRLGSNRYRFVKYEYT